MHLSLISPTARQFFNRTSFLGNTVQVQKMIKCGIQRDAQGSVCFTAAIELRLEGHLPAAESPQVQACEEAPWLNNQV